MSGDLIEERDLPGILGTKDGMIFAYGILWATWGDKNTPASIARHVLLSELTKDDQAKGIEWANRVLGRGQHDQKPSGERNTPGEELEAIMETAADNLKDHTEAECVYTDKIKEETMTIDTKAEDIVVRLEAMAMVIVTGKGEYGSFDFEYLNEAATEINRLRAALGAHIQADAYRDTFPDNEEDGKHLRKQETWWRLTARSWLSDFETNKCAEEAKAKASGKTEQESE